LPQWYRDDWHYINKLPTDQVLDIEVLRSAIEKYAPASRARQIACRILCKFGQFAGLNTEELQPLGRGYRHPIKERKLPTEAEIELAIDGIPSEQWRLVAGLMAAYGLRDHECWHCTVKPEPPYELWVLRGKTGERGPVFPHPVRWVERWQLWELNLPVVTVPPMQTNKIYGTRTSRQFRRYKMPFPPYTLRHAYAVREIELGLHPTIGARLMGHSVTTHTATYQRWISEREIRQAWERIKDSHPLG
jgi:integrase